MLIFLYINPGFFQFKVNKMPSRRCVYAVFRRKLLKKRSEDDLEKHLCDIQQELNSMPTVSKLVIIDIAEFVM